MSNEIAASKTVTVFNTHGQNRNVLSGVTARTWSELQNVLRRNNVSYDGMRAVVGDTQVTLESEGAQIPDQDFTLFLLPSKVRSGNWGDSSNFIQIEEINDEEEEEEEEYDYDEDHQVNPAALALLVTAMQQITQAIQLLASNTDYSPVVSSSLKVDSEIDQLAKQAELLMRQIAR
jgi:hypothetical protein